MPITQAEGSNYLMALDHLDETFQPDLNSMEAAGPRACSRASAS